MSFNKDGKFKKEQSGYKYKKVCLICGAIFPARTKEAETCSPKHSRLLRDRKVINAKQLVFYGYGKCVVCGRKFIKRVPEMHVCGNKICWRKNKTTGINSRRRAKECAPSPKDIIYHGYKDPLIPLAKKYFGYEGVILEDKRTGRIQCHICGRWFKSLGSHIPRMHASVIVKNDPADTYSQAYKDMFGLLRGTTLVSQELAEIMRGHAKRRKLGMDFSQRPKLTRSRSAGGRKAEFKNKNGTCFAQILESIRKAAIYYGRTPSQAEYNKLKGLPSYSTIVNNFGTYSEALRILKLQPNGTSSNLRSQDLTKEFLLALLKSFYKRKKRRPMTSECNGIELPLAVSFVKQFGSLDKAVREALSKK